MNITEVNTTTIRIPLKDPKRFATRTAEFRDYTIVHIHTDEGITGWGYCWGTPLVSEAVDSLLSQYLIGQDPRDIARLWDAMYAGTVVWGRRGIVIRAISAIDIALWDLLGKISNQPIHKLLGGYRDKSRAYYGGGYYPVSCKDDAQLMDYLTWEMETYRNKGFTAFKIKVGGSPPDFDFKRIEKARSIIGDSAELMIDANGAWHPYEAIQFADAIKEYNIRWIEEPVPIDDIEGCAQVASAISIPIAIGENHSTRWEFDQIIEKKAASVLQGDPTLMGGITEWLKLAGVAAIKNIQLAPHWPHDVNVHVALGVKEVIFSEYFEAETDVLNFQLVLQNPVKAKDGYVRPAEGAGHGLLLDMDAVKHYTFIK